MAQTWYYKDVQSSQIILWIKNDIRKIQIWFFEKLDKLIPKFIWGVLTYSGGGK